VALTVKRCNVDELVKSVLAGLPSFAGLILAIYVLREQNQRLLAMLEKHWQPCEADELEERMTVKPT